ncbi:MAG: hypothetical protein AB1772_08335 [Candidatus Zixiibacteriota bacterium]
MKNLSAVLFVCALLAVFGSSCEKRTADADASNELMVPLTEIPASYGDLEAVTVMPEYLGWQQLWFQDDAGTIRIVRINMARNIMHKQIKTINRAPAMQGEVGDNEE